MDGLGFTNERKDLRVDVDGEISWSGAQVEGSGRILCLSSGGVEIADAEALLSVGMKVHVTLAIGDECIESIPTEVVWASEERLGLHFQAQSPELQGQIDALMRKLAGAADGTLNEGRV